VIPLVVAALVYVVQTQVLITSVRAELTSQARLLAQLAFNDPRILVDPFRAQLFIESFSPYLTSQVMLLTPNGLVLASTGSQNSDDLETMITQDEFRQVHDGKIIVHTARETGSADELADVFVPVLAQDGSLIGIVRLTHQTSGFDERFTQIRKLVVWILIGGLGLGVSIGAVLAVQITKPISGVTRAVSDLTRGESLEPLPERGPEEIRQLEIAFNSLVERLRSLEKARKQLLANLVHELGRPLGSLRSAILALQEGAADRIELREDLLRGMDSTTDRLQGLLEELAHLHGQVLGTLELSKQPVNLDEWISSLLTPYRQEALQKGLEWRSELNCCDLLLSIDPDRMAQAIQNLVQNAIQYTQPGGSIIIKTRENPQEIQIQIEDTGSGILPEEQELVWKPFYRGSNRGRFPQGMGLGLNISRDIVNAHGGDIQLSSIPGSGSTFTVCIPRT